MRAGSLALSLLSAPLNAHMLEALEAGPSSLIDLRQAVGSPPQTTIRSHLRVLENLGIVERHREEGFPGSIDYELTADGRELLVVADIVRAWLADAPGGRVELGSVAAKSAITALVDGWSSTIVRALAARPLSQTELNRFIQGLNYPSLGRRLGAMRMAGQIEVHDNGTRGTPYVVSDWLRHSIRPLLAGARWERDGGRADARPIDPLDVESFFLLIVPLIDVPTEVSGACRFVVEIEGDRLAGVTLRVEHGRVFSCTARLRDEANGWAAGSVDGWIQALLDHDAGAIELGGDRELAAALSGALQAVGANPKQRV